MVTQPASKGAQSTISVGLLPNFPARIPLPIAPNSWPMLLREAIQLASSLVRDISAPSCGSRMAENPSTVPGEDDNEMGVKGEDTDQYSLWLHH